MAGVRYYHSPRWSGEITDCALPMTFDQYSLCAFRCLYCFSYFHKAVNTAKRDYLKHQVRAVNVDAVKRIFEEPETSQFGPFVQDRRVMQWGGLADPFCAYEAKLGVGLELIRFFRDLEYPISFSTKGTWWLRRPEYVELFEGADHFHVKVSIITLDEDKARIVESGVASPQKRIEAIARLSNLGIGGVTLRLRPFIIGVSNPSYEDLIRRAVDAGADSVTTEFLCIEQRSRRARHRWEVLSGVTGYDVMKLYREHSPDQGYFRLNHSVKKRYVLRMKDLCDDLGVDFYVSDADWKELSASGCCCGLKDDWNWSRGQFLTALLKAKDDGTVRWSDIEGDLDYADTFKWNRAHGFNTQNSERSAQFHDWSMKDWIRYVWNNVNSRKSPYKYFGGVLYPIDRDAEGDVVYEYRERQA